jgi:hypothetical protein
MANQTADPKESLLALLAETPSLGNGKARDLLHVDGPTYERLKAELLAEGTIKTGRGRGGSIQLVTPSSSPFEQAFRNIDDALWKDPGCTSELDYTEQTSWILFLKYLDDLETVKQMEAELQGKKYTPIIEAKYRWPVWACPKEPDGKLDHHKALSGKDLVEFVNQQLFPYLKGFKQKATGPNTIEYKIGEIFSEISNRVQSGYTLRDVLEHVDALHFRSQEEKHELSHLYEAKIKNMGNAGRNGGEYYTPRPLIKAIVQVVDPQIGDTMYDGAVGSAGFLCEAFDHLSAKAKSTSDHKTLQEKDLLRQGEEEPGLRHRHHEHDPARHRGAQHHPHQHAGGEPRRHTAQGPVPRGAGQPALRRQGAAGGAAELPDQDRRNGLPLPAALHQEHEGRRPRGHRDQEHLPEQYGQRQHQPAAQTAGGLRPAHHPGHAAAAPSKARA